MATLSNVTQIDLSWSDVGNAYTYYEVYRHDSNDSNRATRIASLPVSSDRAYMDMDMGLIEGIIYYYWLKACKGEVGSGTCSDFFASTSAVTKVDSDGNGLIEISSPEMLHNMRHRLNGNEYSDGSTSSNAGCPSLGCKGYELTKDISLAAAYTNWEPIGHKAAFFNAIFDGNGHTINNLKITSVTGDYKNAAGLFGAISFTAVLRNVHIRSAKITGVGSDEKLAASNVGLLVGYVKQGVKTAMILNSSVEGEVVDASGNNIGGLVGSGNGARITSSYAAVASVSGTTYVGGLVGSGHSAIITSSYAVSNTVSGTNNVGGLFGGDNTVTITSSYAAVASVSGEENVGGLIGFGNSAKITSSYAVSNTVSGTEDVGGLVGSGNSAKITSSYAVSNTVKGTTNVGGLLGKGNDMTSITKSYWNSDSDAMQTVNELPQNPRDIGTNTGTAAGGLTKAQFKAISHLSGLAEISAPTTEATCVALAGDWASNACTNYDQPWRLDDGQYPGLLIGECVHRPVAATEKSEGFTVPVCK